MKSALLVASAVALCGSAFAGTGSHQVQHKPGVVDTIKNDAHKIGSAFRQDMHRIARADKFRQEQGMEQQHANSGMDQHHARSGSTAMGAGPADSTVSHDRQARMDEAYARWQRSHR